MKIRRILATAVAAAVTTPVVLLSAAPAFADTKPAAQTQEQKKTVKELQLAVAKAQAALDAAVAHHNELQAAMDAFDEDHPNLVKAVEEAKKAADEAKAAKAAADQKAADAQKALDELPADATEDQKAAAEKDLADAQATAATAKTTAEAKNKDLADANDAYADARIAELRKIGVARKAVEDAKKALDEAKKALEKALAEQPGEPCKEDPNLVTSVTGPKKITAGSSGVFTIRITNKGAVELDEVGGYAEAFSVESPTAKHFRLTWSSANSPKWQPVTLDDGFSSLSALKPGKSFDIKLKVAVDAKAPVGDGVVIVGSAYVNEDGSCGGADEGAYTEFTVTKPAKPGAGTTGGNGNTTQQGGTSTTPVTTGTTGSTTGGKLAATGAGSSTMPIALTGAAAVALGAGAMVVVRRRKAGADA
ncbi:LPXTG cell wall anchor domain-containing protein [Streptomyces roseicoloratus]|uniref:LPXTG cell wall anchor domain-containing protein n=1 Tax=Streptomyces roseicoloratus TaxID=2508722 RepID=A0ABY9RV43_9ACTN|nr:LPXTG cell wall anchor domain-containing protein [Streptomyces roseicoloratus]WMX45604.1 LPXTG cell wall anchor domain-containing protein [Streptomyces roseicoloratus]